MAKKKVSPARLKFSSSPPKDSTDYLPVQAILWIDAAYSTNGWRELCKADLSAEYEGALIVTVGVLFWEDNRVILVGSTGHLGDPELGALSPIMIPASTVQDRKTIGYLWVQ
ncbi:MAG: hypothetical protein D6681_20295 [Calditrichaeota bacterium]|nr:MAG: hypothetical protein D6681_20295 [Calditrichota bacterium]